MVLACPINGWTFLNVFLWSRQWLTIDGCPVNGFALFLGFFDAFHFHPFVLLLINSILSCRT
jgi:hypothetical protein